MDYALEGLEPEPTKEKEPDLVQWYDEEFVAILKFLAIPGIFAVFALILGIVPRAGLYIFAVIYGVALMFKSSRNPEYLMACFVLYIPLSSMMPVSIVTGVNATNIFLMLLIGIAFLDSKPKQAAGAFNANDFEFGEQPAVAAGVRSPLLKFYIFYTSLSMLPAVIAMGTGHLFEHLLTYKGWVDQCLLVFVFASLLKNSERATRIVIYMMIAHVMVVMLGLQEALEKSGLSSIEKSRVVGTIGNPNDYGAFIVYSAGPFVGLALAYMPQLKKAAPYGIPILLMLRVMLATFSRGAYLCFAVGALAASYVRGIRFTLVIGMIGLSAVLIFPSLIPESLLARLGMGGEEEHVELQSEPKLDKSSTMRFAMWDGAMRMTMESPIYGKGFKMFETLIYDYAGHDIEIADPHNMYFYISSQMGLPALIAFVFLWVIMFFRSAYIYKHHPQVSIRGIALGGALIAAAVAVFNLFGSRMVSIETCGFAYLYVLIINRLWQDLRDHKLRNDQEEDFEYGA